MLSVYSVHLSTGLLSPSTKSRICDHVCPGVSHNYCSFHQLGQAWNKKVLHYLDKFGHRVLVSIPALKSQHAWNVRCTSLSVCLTTICLCSLWGTIWKYSMILQRGRSPNWMSGISNEVDHPSDWLVQVRGPVVELMFIQVHQAPACNHTAQRKQPLSISAKRKRFPIGLSCPTIRWTLCRLESTIPFITSVRLNLGTRKLCGIQKFKWASLHPWGPDFSRLQLLSCPLVDHLHCFARCHTSIHQVFINRSNLRNSWGTVTSSTLWHGDAWRHGVSDRNP